tara:strand:+ start:718 stop:870 length:153 start_codon:yes stop_codon:yes gene_type:complete
MLVLERELKATLLLFANLDEPTLDALEPSERALLLGALLNGVPTERQLDE